MASPKSALDGAEGVKALMKARRARGAAAVSGSFLEAGQPPKRPRHLDLIAMKGRGVMGRIHANEGCVGRRTSMGEVFQGRGMRTNPPPLTVGRRWGCVDDRWLDGVDE